MKLQSKSSIEWALNFDEMAVIPAQVHFGKGAQPIQIAVAESQISPSRTLLKELFKARKGRLQVSVIVAVEVGQEVHLFGPDPDSEVLVQKLAVATSFLNSILTQENGILAYQRAISVRRSLQTTDMPGFTNNGLFASHYIRTSIPSHPRWDAAQKKAIELQGLRNRDLIEGLGFEVTSSPARTLLLSAKGNSNRVVAILLEANETFETKSERFQASPVEWGLGVASQQGAPWVVAIRDSQIRLYPAKDGVGVGQKSQAETFFEVDLLTIDEDRAGLLSLVFSADALSENGSADELLENSHKFASDLGKRLRERVYESVVPDLAKEVANQLRSQGYELDIKGLHLAYELTLRVLFRLLFQAYAEDRGLLPSGRNELFDSNSIKHWADHLIKRDPDASFGESSTIWWDLRQIWDAIDQGNPDMQVPAYNGGLFGADALLHPEGYLISALVIPDRVMGPAIRALVVDDITEDGVAGPVDFRSLSVREFGTIYEGLLESSLSVADEDLTVDKKGAWVPALDGQSVIVYAGEIYFHSASGERKATGSYYTPSFIVDHLVDTSVTPALTAHLEQVKELIDANDQAGAYSKFFDFRVADLAMGSAHFLVATVDKIEGLMRSFLIQPGNEIEGINAELLRLEIAAKEALGLDEAAFPEIERASLLRRQIARRCIYGLDINSLAVELSRLAIWIHTFVPGLPMSSLEHNLVCANSLTGIGSTEEGLNALIPGRRQHGNSLFDSLMESSLLEAKVLLEDVANADEATKKQARKSAEASKNARDAAAKSKIIFDLAVANRHGVISTGAAFTEDELVALWSKREVSELIAKLNPAHLPYLFPEVFLRSNPGFDVLVGNPPFKEAVVEELEFWNRKFKGLKGMSSGAQIEEIHRLEQAYPSMSLELAEQKEAMETLRKALGTGPYPGMGTGDPDLYKAFAWRFMDLCRLGGSFGLVMPHSIWTTKGNFEWRKNLLTNSKAEVVLVINSQEWAFENVNPGYRFTFISAEKGATPPTLKIKGTYSSRVAFEVGRVDPAAEIDSNVILAADPNCSLPALDGDQELKLWSKLVKFPSLGDGRLAGGRVDIRCAPATDIHVSLDGKQGVFTANSSDHPIFNHLNVSRYKFDVSQGAFNFGDFETYVAGQEISAHPLLTRSDSAMRLWGKDRLLRIGHPIRHPRIVFRDVVHASNKRKVWAALAPANTLLTNKAPYLIFDDDSVAKQAYLLGVLNSGVVDWFAHLKVGLNLNFFILYTLPVPVYSGTKPQRRIAELAAGLATGGLGNFESWSDFGQVLSDEETRSAAMVEIDSLVADEFELSKSELKTVFESDNPTRSSLSEIEMFRQRVKND